MPERNSRVIWAPAAKRDLRDIWRYFVRVASPEVADRLLRDIRQASLRVALISRRRLKPATRHSCGTRWASWRARGMAEIAKVADLNRESLYKALGGTGNPEFGTVMRVLQALGLTLSARPAERKKRPPRKRRAA